MRSRIPGVLKITINDEDHPDDPERWTIEQIERMDKLNGDEPFVICFPLTVPLGEPDNKLGTCAGCGCGIQFRPNNTVPIKICSECAESWVVRHARSS